MSKATENQNQVKQDMVKRMLERQGMRLCLRTTGWMGGGALKDAAMKKKILMSLPWV